MKKIFKNFIFIFVFVVIVIPTNCFSMQIYVNTLTGESITIEVESTDTIEAVKVKIYEGFKEKGNEEFLPELQRLVFNSTNLEDGRTLADYVVPKESTIHVILRKTFYNINYKLSNLTSINLEKVEMGKDLEITLAADSNYRLPDSISVSMSEEVFDKFTYDKETGKVIILSDDITGDIEISAEAIEIEEDNPKTFDNITQSILIGTVSLIGSISLIIFLNKRLKV